MKIFSKAVVYEMQILLHLLYGVDYFISNYDDHPPLKKV